jgi:hypothetical protein
MSSCHFFKKGYFGVCSASESEHIPSIDDMDRYCFKENVLCPIFEIHNAKKYQPDKIIILDTACTGLYK